MTDNNPDYPRIEPAELEKIEQIGPDDGLGFFLRSQDTASDGVVFIQAENLPTHVTGRDIPSITGVKPVYVDEDEYFNQ